MVSSSGLSSILSGGEDVIVACASAAGFGALAIVRLSGAHLEAVAGRLCPGLETGRARQAQLVAILDPAGGEIDRGIGIFFSGPASYTGEDVLELTVHGSPFLVREIISSAIKAGARRARPGEFSRRAVANGKMDLPQAEAVDQLIRAESAWQARLAREQLHGRLSAKIGILRQKLVELLAAAEASLDYVEQGVLVSDTDLLRLRNDCLKALDFLLGTLKLGRKIRQGMKIVVLGPPNTGKSSLFNRLCREERAIVTPRAGTTRDLLEVYLEIEGIPVCLVDTAGLRESRDEVEIEGMTRARESAAGADLLLLVGDHEARYEDEVPPHQEVIRIRNKIDISPPRPDEEMALPLSAKYGDGIEELRKEIHRRIEIQPDSFEDVVAINARQAEALSRARSHLLFDEKNERELIVEEIRLAVERMDEVLGKVDGEEILDAVFQQFCVGK